jgi:hypothetical protein
MGAWGGKRPGAGRKPCSTSRRSLAKIKLLPAQAHRQAVAELPLDILMRAARDEAQPIEIRLAAARAAAPYYHAKVSSGPPKAAFEMSELELQAAIEREKEHRLRTVPGQRTFRVIGQG